MKENHRRFPDSGFNENDSINYFHSEILNKLKGELPRVFFLRNGSPDAASLMTSFFRECEKLPPDRPNIFIISGPPNVGKTYFRKNRIDGIVKSQIAMSHNKFKISYLLWDDLEVELRSKIDKLRSSRFPMDDSFVEELVSLKTDFTSKEDSVFIEWSKHILDIKSREFKRNPKLFLDLVGKLMKKRALEWCEGVKSGDSKAKTRQILILEKPGPQAFPLLTPSIDKYKCLWLKSYPYETEMISDISNPEKGDAHIAYLGLAAGPFISPRIVARELLLNRKSNKLPYQDIIDVFGQHLVEEGGTWEQIHPAWKASFALYVASKNYIDLPDYIRKFINIREKMMEAITRHSNDSNSKALSVEIRKLIASSDNPIMDNMLKQADFMDDLLSFSLGYGSSHLGNMFANAAMMEVIAQNFTDQFCVALNNPSITFYEAAGIKNFLTKIGYYKKHKKFNYDYF